MIYLVIARLNFADTLAIHIANRHVDKKLDPRMKKKHYVGPFLGGRGYKPIDRYSYMVRGEI